MERTRLVVLFGGTSSEHEISLRSAASVIAAADRDRFEVVPVGIRRDRGWRLGQDGQELEAILSDGPLVPDVRDLNADLVFPVLHGPNGEDGTIQGLLELAGIAYVGSGVLASAVCMDKAIQKHVIAAAAPEVPLVPWLEFDARNLGLSKAVDAAAARVEHELGFPCFVKPANLGSSVGVVKCTTRDEVAEALRTTGTFDLKIMVERGIDAREVEIAVLGNGGPETLTSAPGEIELPPGTWYDYEAKYIKDVATYHIPASLPSEVDQAIRLHAKTAFRATGCSGLARIDFFLERETGTPYLNELNTMPGFTSISMYPKMMAAAGMAYPELVNRLCDLGLERHASRRGLRVDR